MCLSIPIVQMHYVTAAERTRPIKAGGLFVRCLPEHLLPLFFPGQPVGIHVSVTGLVPHQFHEPLRRLAFDLEHHRPPQRAEPIVYKEERNENRRNADRHEPLIANVRWWMKRESLGG